jgi:hypothetical protein
VTDPAGVDALARRLRRVGPRAVRALPAPGGTP